MGNKNATKDTANVIEFSAQVQKVQTLADLGIRITLDISEADIETAKKMMEVRRAGAVLRIAAVAVYE